MKLELEKESPLIEDFKDCECRRDIKEKLRHEFKKLED
jgi:hypothetical protein